MLALKSSVVQETAPVPESIETAEARNTIGQNVLETEDTFRLELTALFELLNAFLRASRTDTPEIRFSRYVIRSTSSSFVMNSHPGYDLLLPEVPHQSGRF
jgi:hypothetical protein